MTWQLGTADRHISWHAIMAAWEGRWSLKEHGLKFLFKRKVGAKAFFGHNSPVGH